MKKQAKGVAAKAGHIGPWAERYREKWSWDKIAWASHCINCYPGNCQYRVYLKDGVVVREEQSGTYTPIEAGVPDMNPMGCQKGNAWSRMLHSPERVLYPLKRAGERGEGNWDRVSWDEALCEIADATLDAIQESGPESVLQISTSNEGGLMAGMLFGRIIEGLGGTVTDVNADINDFNPGLYITYGKVNSASSVDDWFHAELTLVWHRNPVYTAIPWYHFVLESRYNGGEIVVIAPDYSPSAIHADYHVPVEPGSDAALALGMSQVIIEEAIYDTQFVREQTDLPLLVQTGNRRFLRQTELKGEGRDDQFYVFDKKTGEVVEAPRATLDMGEIEPALEGRFQVKLADGERVGIGGHSYGAFMTANLLAHSDLFAAGVARSGAYNRTLTPFGFQAERRPLWEAPAIYFKISPFMPAAKINAPLPPLPGQTDHNSGLPTENTRGGTPPRRHVRGLCARKDLSAKERNEWPDPG